MNLFESRTLIAWLACVLAVQTAQAQPPMATPEPGVPLIDDAPGQAVAGNYFGYTEVDRAFEPLLRVDTRGGRMYGQDGFTRISAFMPRWIEENALVFADVGAMALYNPSGGANAGLGWRYYNPDFDRIIGFNGFYDYDPGHIHDYNQFSIGFESLGRYLDYRANGYVPFGSQTNVLSSSLTGPVSFLNNNILLGRITGRELAMTGFDAEIGGPVPLLGRYGLSTYVGAYYFDGNNTGNITGFSSRTQGQLNEDLSIGAQVTHDSVFDTNVQIQVTWTLPDGMPGRWLRQPRVRDRLTAPVIRSYRVITREDTLTNNELALNPADGAPFFVVHVNPNRTPGTGNGTFENPFSQISQFDTMGGKPGVDIIYVTARDDNTSTQLNTGVTLLNNQRLLSTAVQHTFTAIQGTFALPGFVGGNLPILSNDAGGNVVTFATGNRNIEVSGFTIDGSATGNSIRGHNNQAININRNTITDGLNGVLLTNLSGVGAGNRTLINDNDFLSNRGDGLAVINNAANPLEIFITDNTAVSNLGNGFRLQSDNGSLIGGRITGNSTVNTGTIGSSNVNNGLALFTNGGTIDFLNAVNDWRIGGTGTNDTNNFSENGNFGISLLATGGGDILARVLDNDISRNSLNGLGLGADSGNHTLIIGGADATLGNRFANNGLNGVSVALTGTAVMDNMNIQFNTFTQNGAGGLGGGTGGAPVALFNPELVFGGGLTASQQAIFALAVAKWQTIITGDLVDVGAIDDVQINASGVAIDGVNGILGQAGPTGFRPGSFLPFSGDMQFDTADLAALEAAGQLDDVILHEMGHVFGIGTIWTNLGLLTGAGTADPRFTGANALAEYNTRFGVAETGVPVENTGGPGTADAHWRESVFTNELMTGFLNPGVANPISRVTVGGLQDLGYAVNYAAADPFLQGAAAGVARPIGQVVSSATTFAGPATPMAAAAAGNLVAPGAAIGDGINISMTNTSSMTTSTILDNTIQQSARHGVYVATEDTSVLNNLNVQRNTIVDNGTGTTGSGIFLNRFDSSTLNMTARTNVVTDNLGDGLTVNSQNLAGTVNIISSDNNFNDNAGSGMNLQSADAAGISLISDRDIVSSNNANGVNAFTEDTSTITLTLRNILGDGNNLDGLNLEATDLSTLTATVSSPVDPLFTGIRSRFSQNGQNGIQATSDVRANLSLNLNTVDVTANVLGDGINLSRADTSLLRANLNNVTATGNGSDGLEFFYAGADQNDPLQPLSGTPNSLTVLNSRFNSNTLNGMNIQGRGDAVMRANITTSTFNSNTNGNGILVQTFESAAFGVDATTVSEFDGVTVTGNTAGNGIELSTNSAVPFGSFIFLDITSDTSPTLISNNINGIEINAGGNTTDVEIRGDGNAATTGTTTISNNTADGIHANIAGSALNTNIEVHDVTISDNTDDGIEVINDNSGAGVNQVLIGTAGEITRINGNGDAGVTFDQEGSNDFISAVVTDTTIQGNDGHGFSMDGDGPLAENSISSGYSLNMTGSNVSGNGLNGVNITLHGHMLGNSFTLDNNVFDNNGSQGTDRFNSNGVFINLNAQDTLKTTGALFRQVSIPAPSAFPVNPLNPALTGSGNYQAPYMNTTTALDANLVFTNNTVRFNGNNALGTGDGLYLRVSTNASLTADVGGANGSGDGNTFSGNTLADFRTGSFIATARATGLAVQPPAGTDNTDPTADIIFLDDSAQLDLRFFNNTGTDLNPSITEQAQYTNVDPAKAIFGGGASQPRNVQLFQVQGPAATIDASNVFTLPGFPGDTESDFFNAGNYTIFP